MKKILVLLLLCCFCSCSAGPSPEQILLKTQETLSSGCEFALDFSTGQEATLFWSASEQWLCFTAPEAVEGLCYVRDSAGLTVSFEGISAKISAASLPQSAAVSELFDTFDALLVAGPSPESEPRPPWQRIADFVSRNSQRMQSAAPEALDCETESDGLLKVTPRNSPRGLPAVWIDTETSLPIAVKTEHWDAALALTDAL